MGINNEESTICVGLYWPSLLHTLMLFVFNVIHVAVHFIINSFHIILL